MTDRFVITADELLQDGLDHFMRRGIASSAATTLRSWDQRTALLLVITAHADRVALAKQAGGYPGGKILDSHLATLRQRASTFLAHLRANVTTLNSDVSLDNLPMVEQLAHSMRDAGGIFGFQLLTNFGAALEAAAAACD